MKLPVILLVSSVLALGACGSKDNTVTARRVAGTPDPAHQVAPPVVPADTSKGTFEPYRAGASAVTYNPKVVPPGATAQVTTQMTAKGTTVRLAVTGMVPRRAYGAHLHTMPCTREPAMAGPHYQHQHAPTPNGSPAPADPSYANPQNEVWLDFTAGPDGTASATSAEPWAFDETRPPRSLVIHEGSTRTGAGVAGTAGARAACLTLTHS